MTIRGDFKRSERSGRPLPWSKRRQAVLQAPNAGNHDPLTAREAQVASLLDKLPRNQVASILGIKPGTLRVFIKNLRRKGVIVPRSRDRASEGGPKLVTVNFCIADALFRAIGTLMDGEIVLRRLLPGTVVGIADGKTISGRCYNLARKCY